MAFEEVYTLSVRTRRAARLRGVCCVIRSGVAGHQNNVSEWGTRGRDLRQAASTLSRGRNCVCSRACMGCVRHRQWYASFAKNTGLQYADPAACSHYALSGASLSWPMSVTFWSQHRELCAGDWVVAELRKVLMRDLGRLRYAQPWVCQPGSRHGAIAGQLRTQAVAVRHKLMQVKRVPMAFPTLVLWGAICLTSVSTDHWWEGCSG
jgi:hypothetical protein